MKKIFSVLLSVLVLLSLAGCSSGSQETTQAGDDAQKSYPVISLVSENTAVNPGDEIQVKLNIKNAQYTACFDIYVNADDALEYMSASTAASELILAANEETLADEKHVVVRGMIAATYDIDDEDICVITYKVSEDVASGTRLNLTVQSPMYQVGLDESGNDVYSVSDNITYNGLVIEVK